MKLKLSFEPTLAKLDPIYITEDYSIESPDYISDSPVKLLGFVNSLGTARKAVMDLDYQTFYAHPALATNKYMILVNQQSEWLSIDAKIIKVEIIEEG